MKLSQGTTTAMAKDVACGMRSFLLFLHLAHPFFSSRPASGGRASVCFRDDVLRDNVPSLFDGITLCALSFTCDVSVGQVPKVLQSLATPQRTYEYPIFMVSHFPLFSPALFDFLRESAVHSSFDFSSMFVFAWIIQPLPYCLFLLSISFFSAFFPTKARKENIMKKNCSAIVVMISFSNYKWRFALNIRLFLCDTSIVAFRYFTFSFTSFTSFFKVSTLSIPFRGEISFYFQMPLLLARVYRVIPFELPSWQATWHPVYRRSFFCDNFCSVGILYCIVFRTVSTKIRELRLSEYCLRMFFFR